MDLAFVDCTLVTKKLELQSIVAELGNKLLAQGFLLRLIPFVQGDSKLMKELVYNFSEKFKLLTKENIESIFK